MTTSKDNNVCRVEEYKISRISWVDIVRGIGIILVILGHTYRNNPVLIWITSFHMPLFFVLSGWLVGNKKKNIDSDFILTKIKNFIIPLVEFLILTYLYWVVIESRFRAFDIGPMWFLVVLFIIEIISATIYRYFDITGVVVAMIVSILSVFYFSKLNIESSSFLAWIPRTIGGGTFYLMGMILSRKADIKNVQVTIKKNKWGLLLIFLALIGSIVCSQLNGRVDLYFLKFNHVHLYYLAAVLGSIVVYLISMKIENLK